MFDSHMDNIYQRANSILTTVVLTVHRTLHLGLKLFKPVLYFSISCILLLPLLSLLQSET